MVWWSSQVAVGPVPLTIFTVSVGQPAPARRPLWVQIVMLPMPPAGVLKSLFSSPSWTRLITFCHIWAAGLPFQLTVVL